MRWFKYCKFLMVCCLVAVFSGCEEDDDYRGYMLSGRWFGNLGMMVDGQPAIGSDLEFIPQDYGGYTQGYGYETDYYYGWRGRVEIVEHYFTWTVSKAQKFGKGLLRFYFMSKRNVCFVRLYGSERLPYPCNLAMNFLRSTIKRRCSPSPMVPVSSSAMTLKVSLRPSIPVSTAVAVMVLPKAVGLR